MKVERATEARQELGGFREEQLDEDAKAGLESFERRLEECRPGCVVKSLNANFNKSVQHHSKLGAEKGNHIMI